MKSKERRKEKTFLFTRFTGTARDEETLSEGSMVAAGRDNLMAVWNSRKAKLVCFQAVYKLYEEAVGATHLNQSF